MKQRMVKKVLGMALIGTLAVTLFGQAVLHLWNWLMPVIFGLPQIGFWQALGLTALSWILFGMRGMHTGGRHGCGGGRHLSPEQREQFRSRFGQRCGGRGKSPVTESV